jgi:hypothetical protein
MPVGASPLASFGTGFRFSLCGVLGYLLSRESTSREGKNGLGTIRVVREIRLEKAQSIPNPAKNHICV